MSSALQRVLLISALFLSLPQVANCADLDQTLDPRLDAFLARVIKDPATLRAEKAAYAENKVSFEDLVLVVYTAKVALDGTPDNSHALAQLGEYIEQERPKMSRQLLASLEKFYSSEENKTFMRGMFLETVRGVAEK